MQSPKLVLVWLLAAMMPVGTGGIAAAASDLPPMSVGGQHVIGPPICDPFGPFGICSVLGNALWCPLHALACLENVLALVMETLQDPLWLCHAPYPPPCPV